MIISARRILELSEKHRLIDNLDKRELNPEGTGFDLRVGEVYRLKGDGFLGVEDRKTPDTEKIADITKDKEFTLKPGDFVLVKTMEKISIPSEKILVDEAWAPMHLMANVHPRSTLQRSGLYLRATKTDPGYTGELTFALVNHGPSTIRLELGSRIANLVFHGVIGELSRAYGGQWNGGRVSTGAKERQI
jgi:deoxycytidine triphosphate deaminase